MDHNWAGMGIAMWLFIFLGFVLFIVLIMWIIKQVKK